MLFYMCEDFACIYAPCTCLAPEEARRRLSDPLGLDLWMVVSHSVGSRNQTWVLCKSNKCSNHRDISAQVAELYIRKIPTSSQGN